MCESLSQVLSRDHETVFRGTERGGSIAFIGDIPSQDKVDPRSIYTEKYKTPFYLTIISDKARGNNHFIIELDEYYPVNGVVGWYKRIGAGYLINDNELVFNENEGISSRFQFISDEKFRLYRERNTVIWAVASKNITITEPKYPFINAGSAYLSSLKDRSREINRQV